MVPRGVAFPRYEIFRCRYKITSKIVPGNRVAGHQRSHQGIAGWWSFRVDKGIELRLVATILALNYTLRINDQFLDGSQRESDSESIIKVDGYGWTLSDTRDLFNAEQVVPADSAVFYKCKLFHSWILILCESAWLYSWAHVVSIILWWGKYAWVTSLPHHHHLDMCACILVKLNWAY